MILLSHRSFRSLRMVRSVNCGKTWAMDFSFILFSLLLVKNCTILTCRSFKVFTGAGAVVFFAGACRTAWASLIGSSLFSAAGCQFGPELTAEGSENAL